VLSAHLDQFAYVSIRATCTGSFGYMSPTESEAARGDHLTGRQNLLKGLTARLRELQLADSADRRLAG
jgi:hypothetical protein